MEELRNINISGTGKINGGKFAEVSISGLGQILSDLEANRIEISGMGTIKGNVKTQRFLTSGNGTVEGLLEGSDLDTSGNFKVNGPVNVKEIRIQGRNRFNDSVKAEKITCTGYLSVGKDLETEDFRCSGSFAVEGLLNANKVEIEINGFCYAREIGCEEIRVEKSSSMVPLHFLHKLITPFLGPKRELNKLTANVLEGTIVNICDTQAKIVRGNKVRIGPGCNIGVVEYSEELEVDEEAVVEKQILIS
ncbi:Protein of unknown function, DUF583 [Desulfosporosinus orientis DSM 765]|uniref:Integral membrane protein CcmA involved in cell shape determination n=1 Tax=Desulfosporosinus orientis (strain ATCC 19365 / DSM 765 / NCIMB 8382 / VKM B-1628 / Singapore I) TaxID=768706 RepID=G7WH66_DESOD|nr:hypothetical protein [Desulfosporosinus orientis]AET69574.1 Protein of unknown function, DUF583 [Desulfosporosinus orientis DSM 765]